MGLPEGLDVADSPSLGLRLVGALVKRLGGTAQVGRQGGTAWRIVLPAAA
ncbi:MAG: hypothetical protein AB1505_20945 [Candidatus Latescibacterota bacterium]